MSEMDSLKELRTVKDFKARAISKAMSGDAKEYFMATAGENGIRCVNEMEFSKYRIHPLALRDVSEIDTTVTLLGNPVASPIGISPVAHKSLIHPNGEAVTAFAAAEEGCPVILSCMSVGDIDKVAEKAPKCTRWMQIYIFKDRSLTLRVVKKAEARGFSALVVTVDSPVGGQWRVKVTPGLSERLAFRHRITEEQVMLKELLDPSLTFEDLRWLRSVTKLPVVVKGILTGNDAVRSLRHGASAVLVSNHGARQIDSVCSTVDALRNVVDEVKSEDPSVEVYLDGGVRTGSDVFKALALGARAVFVGRPVIWGLAVGLDQQRELAAYESKQPEHMATVTMLLKAESGVKKVLQILKSEFLSTMRLSGVRSLAELNRSMISKPCSCCRL